LLQYFPTLFLFYYSVSPHVVLKNYLCRLFFNIELLENSALIFPTCFFLFFHFFIFFFQNCLLIFLCFFYFIFKYRAGWEFSFVVLKKKHCELLQCFPTWFFSFFYDFFCFFSRIVFVDSIFFILSWLRI